MTTKYEFNEYSLKLEREICLFARAIRSLLHVFFSVTKNISYSTDTITL